MQNTSNAYDLRLFEGGAAPKRAPQPVQRPAPPTLVRKKRPSQAQIRAQQMRTARQTVKVMLVSALILALFGMKLYGNVKLDELNREYTGLQEQLNLTQSENTRLNMDLKSRVSLDKVENYAANVLGMVKQESYQIEYVDLSKEDGVVVAGGKQAQAKETEKTSWFDKLLSYIF